MSEYNTEPTFEIPIVSAIARFHDHLNNHDRTILSAKFGDGKSFFLQKFMADENVNRDFKLLILYPVNYQVEETRDVFELIKYDLLIQLFVQEIMEPNIKLTKAQALGWCLQLHAPSLAEGVLPVFSNLCLDEASAKMVAAFLTAKNVVGKIKRKVDEFAEPIIDKQITQFLKEMAKNPIVSQDVISGIIQQGIADYKKNNPDKKVVLVIEDMDRMDPAHLFRILNIFSAHIDYNYRFGDYPHQPYTDNKFGLDKIVFVMSYENTERIFHHFYGEETDFKGYINKFCSSNIFHYSFTEEKQKYLYNRIMTNTMMDPMTLQYIVKPEFLKDRSVREIINAIENLDGFVKPIEAKDRNNQPITIHYGGLKAIAILRKLGLSDDNIKEIINRCLSDKSSYKMVLSYLACPLAIANRGRLFSNKVQYRKRTSIEPSIFEIERVNDNGRAECQFYMDKTNGNKDESAMLLDKLLGMLSA